MSEIKRETAILACAASALMSALLVSYHHKRKASNGVKVNFVSWCGGRKSIRKVLYAHTHTL